MKITKVLSITLLILLTFTTIAFAQVRKAKSPIFMGEVEAVDIDEANNIMRITTKGYIKNCTIYKEEIVAIVSTETLIIPKECPMDMNQQYEKVNPVEFLINKGDSVYFVLSEAMTKSIPPQVAAKAIQVTTAR